MGQKSIPQSIRLDYLKNWNSNWVSEKKDYSKIFFFDYTLNAYLQSYLKKNKIKVNFIKIIKQDKIINVYLNLYQFSKKKSSNLNILIKKDIDNYLKYLNLPFSSKVHIVNSTLRNLKIGYIFYKKFKKFKRIPSQYYSFINLSYIAFYTQNIELITKFLVEKLKNVKKHRWYLKNINRILNKQFSTFDNCIGYKLQLKGRVNTSARSKKIVIKNGKTPLNTLKYKVKYDFKEVLTPRGVCSVKLWLFYIK